MKKILTIALMLFSVVAFSQKITLKSGDLSGLKGQKFIKIEYDYSTMRVGKYADEKDYVADKVKAYNEKEAGRGDTWKKSWEGDRGSRFQPNFEELLNKYLTKAGVFVGPENKDAAYKFVVKTTRTEPGYNIYVSRMNAEIDIEVIVYKDGKEVARIISKNNPGRTFGGNDYDSGERIQEAYAKAGKEIGNWLSKNYLK